MAVAIFTPNERGSVPGSRVHSLLLSLSSTAYDPYCSVIHELLVGPYLYFAGDAMSRILERCTWTTSSYVPVPWLFLGM